MYCMLLIICYSCANGNYMHEHDMIDKFRTNNSMKSLCSVHMLNIRFFVA